MSKGPNILYIEDEQLMIDMVDQILNLSGYDYQMRGITSGEKGLEIMRQHKTDVLLLDLIMPQTNGWDVYREMKQDKSLADIPVIVISASLPEKGHKLADDLPPVDDYITKPFDIKQLISSVKKITEITPPPEPAD